MVFERKIKKGSLKVHRLWNLGVFAVAKGRGVEQVGLRCQVLFGVWVFFHLISDVFSFWWNREVDWVCVS